MAVRGVWEIAKWVIVGVVIGVMALITGYIEVAITNWNGPMVPLVAILMGICTIGMVAVIGWLLLKSRSTPETTRLIPDEL